jgi:hypothetical protein
MPGEALSTRPSGANPAAGARVRVMSPLFDAAHAVAPGSSRQLWRRRGARSRAEQAIGDRLDPSWGRCRLRKSVLAPCGPRVGGSCSQEPPAVGHRRGARSESKPPAAKSCGTSQRGPGPVSATSSAEGAGAPRAGQHGPQLPTVTRHAAVTQHARQPPVLIATDHGTRARRLDGRGRLPGPFARCVAPTATPTGRHGAACGPCRPVSFRTCAAPCAGTRSARPPRRAPGPRWPGTRSRSRDRTCPRLPRPGR